MYSSYFVFLCFLHITYLRYKADMGDLRLRTVLNTGLRIEPPLDTRIAEYRKFLSEGGMIISSVKIIVGIKGRGLAMVTALPEVLDKKCPRMGGSSTNVEMLL